MILEHEAMTGAIHGFQAICFTVCNIFSFEKMIMLVFMCLKHEEIVFVVAVMSRNFPQIDVEHVWGDYLLIAPL